MAISSKTTMWVVMIFGIISMGSLNVKAQSPAMAPGPESAGTDCITLAYSMADCVTYAEKGSKLAKPDKACCPELAEVLNTNPICLCQLLSKSKDFPVELDMKRTIKLPSVCKLQTPDISLCSAAGYPVGPPAKGPTSSAGPSSALPAGMSPAAVMSPEAAAAMSPGEAGGASSGKNGASNVHFNVAYVVAGLAMAFTLLKL